MTPPRYFLILLLMIVCFSSVFSVEVGAGSTITSPPNIQFTTPTNLSAISVNDSYFWQGYTPSTLPHNFLGGLQGGRAGFYYHLNDTQYSSIGSFYNGSYVPYNGATGNINLDNNNITLNKLNATIIYLNITCLNPSCSSNITYNGTDVLIEG